MLLQEDYVDLMTPQGVMRTFIFRPAAAGQFPGIVLFAEIYHMTGPIARTARLIASHGYVVAVPEIYHDLKHRAAPSSTTLPIPIRATAIRRKRR